jgi:hypothetical protein
MRAANVRTVSMKPGWADYEYGPYEKFPEPRQLTLEGYLMQRYDPTIGAALTLIKRLILGHLGNYRHPDERRQEFVRSNLAGLRGGMKASVASLLSCLWAGFTVAAKRWESRPEGWTIAALDLLHPLTLFPTSGGGGNEADRQGMRTDETGEVVGFRQFSTRAGEPPVDFEREDVLYWPFMQEVREEVYGKRLTDKARRSWFMRTKIERFWAVHLEKFAHPIPIFRVPKGTQVGPAGNDISNSEFYGGFIGNLTAGQGLAIEAAPDDQFSFDLLESGSGSSDAYLTAARYHNAELFKSALMSPLLLEDPQHGTRAQADTALGLTIMLVEAIREELEGVLVQDLARPLIEYNFGAGDDYGSWDFEPLQDEDLEGLSRVLESVTRSGVIQPNDADERKVRERYSRAGIASDEEITDADRQAADEEEQRDAEAAAARQEARAAVQVPAVAEDAQP